MMRACIAVLALSVAGPASAQVLGAETEDPPAAGLPETVELGTVGRVGNAAAGRAIYRDYCERCHAPSELAAQLFLSSGEPLQSDLCVFLETHGRTDQERDCDIVAYLKVLAQRQAE